MIPTGLKWGWWGENIWLDTVLHHQLSQYAIETLSLVEGKEICQHKHMNLSSKAKD